MASLPATHGRFRRACGALRPAVAPLLLIVAALAFQAAPAVMACSASGVDVSDILNSLENPTFNPDGSYARYSKDQVDAHFESQPPKTFADNTKTTFSCVDARGDSPVLGTPGGDLAEIIAATMAWFKMERKAVNKADIVKIFTAFMANIASPSRPIFFHTDDSRLRQLFQLMQDAGITPKPSILPDRAPENADLWLDNLVKPEVQGCGHIRLMLDPNTTKYYSIRLSGREVVNCADITNPADCINSAEVAAEVIKMYFNYWWPTPAGSPERARVKYVVDLGPLVGKAVAIVTPSSTAGRCAGVSPLAQPNYRGSTLFVYHDLAVKSFRTFAARTTGPWLGLDKGGLSLAKRRRWAQLWTDVASVQLGATLTYLVPANNIGLFAVNVTTLG